MNTSNNNIHNNIKIIKTSNNNNNELFKDDTVSYELMFRMNVKFILNKIWYHSLHDRPALC